MNGGCGPIIYSLKGILSNNNKFTFLFCLNYHQITNIFVFFLCFANPCKTIIKYLLISVFLSLFTCILLLFFSCIISWIEKEKICICLNPIEAICPLLKHKHPIFYTKSQGYKDNQYLTFKILYESCFNVMIWLLKTQ